MAEVKDGGLEQGTNHSGIVSGKIITLSEAIQGDEGLRSLETQWTCQHCLECRGEGSMGKWRWGGKGRERGL